MHLVENPKSDCCPVSACRACAETHRVFAPWLAMDDPIHGGYVALYRCQHGKTWRTSWMKERGACG